MKKKKKRSKIRHNTGFFKSGDSKSLEQFIIASIITGAFTGMGAVLGTVLAKYVLKEVEQNVPMPPNLNAIVQKETAVN